ncbi:conserved hypothetical protein, partial [Ricinus communis]
MNTSPPHHAASCNSGYSRDVGSAEAAGGHARHIDAHGEDGAGQRMGGQLLGRVVFARGGDEQRLQVVAAEGAGGGIAHRHGDRLQQLAVRRVTADAAAAPLRDPHAAFAVDRHAVRRTLALAELAPHARRAQRAVGGQRIGVDATFVAVGVVHGGAVQAEGRAVADVVGVVGRVQLVVGVQPEQRADRLRVIGVVHGTGPEAAGGVDLGVVHAQAAALRERTMQVFNAQFRFQPHAGDAVAQAGHETVAVAPGDQPADVVRH